MKRKIILASSSPRRIDMMKKHGYHPQIQPADIDEQLPDGISARDAVMFLALKKALFVEKTAEKGSIIIAADTVVYKDGILGKPADREEAFSMLTKIKNTGHQVATGVAMVIAGESFRTVFCDVTEVFCKDYSHEELNAYLDTDEPYDKAGAYAIQGIFGKYIDRFEGSFNTVVGFPWELIEPRINELLARDTSGS